MPDTPPPTTAEHTEPRTLVALLLRALAGAALSSAATVAVLAWVETWADAPDFGVATYLFWPLTVGALVLLGCAARLGSTDAGRESR